MTIGSFTIRFEKSLEEVMERENDIIRGNYTKDEEAYDIYTTALATASRMRDKGLCTFKADDPDKPYEIHAIDLKWIPDDMDIIEPDMRLLRAMLATMQLTIEASTATEWQISIPIYAPEA